MEFCYTSQADKRRRYPVETVPAILAAAQRGARDLDQRRALVAWMQANNANTAEALHDAARAGTYRQSDRDECDPIQEVSETIANGGDCDQWAAVIMAGLRVLGFARVYLVTAGDEADPYRHAAVEFFAGGRMWLCDPKADQTGHPFNTRADMPHYPRRQHWRLA